MHCLGGYTVHFEKGNNVLVTYNFIIRCDIKKHLKCEVEILHVQGQKCKFYNVNRRD